MSTLVTGSVPGARELRRAPVLPPVAEALGPIRCHRRRIMRFFAVGAAGMVPWTVLMALTLPAEHQVHQWRLTWAGFDVLLIAALTATAVLLICDAWFDVSLDVGTGDIWLSAGMALFVELPVAAVLIYRAYSVLSSMAARTAQPPRNEDSSAV